jgi:hypothetical protein
LERYPVLSTTDEENARLAGWWDTPDSVKSERASGIYGEFWDRWQNVQDRRPEVQPWFFISVIAAFAIEVVPGSTAPADKAWQA